MGWLDDCRDRCRRIKYVSEKLVWDEKANHVGSLKATSQLLDNNYAAIPGLYFKGIYSPKPLTGDVYSFALMATQARDHHRVFMLEVYPPHVVSHRGKTEWLKGPHVHLGDKRLEQITRAIRGNLDAISVNRWIERFRRHAKVHDNDDLRLTHPLSDTLFG
jgi:hypothetical protein